MALNKQNHEKGENGLFNRIEASELVDSNGSGGPFGAKEASVRERQCAGKKQGVLQQTRTLGKPIKYA